MKMVVAFTLMMLLASCSKTMVKSHRIDTETAKIIKIDEELTKDAKHPAPVYLRPENCPLVVDEYFWILEDVNRRFKAIREAQDEFIED